MEWGILCCPNDENNFSNNLQSMSRWINDRSIQHHGEHGVLERLFGLPLPENLVSAMADFLLERLYRTSVYDVDHQTYLNAFGVRPYMVRFCIQKPEKASIVWDCLEQAIQNAIAVVSELDVLDIEEREQKIFLSVTRSLICTCMDTRAQNVIPVLRRLYQGTSLALLGPNIISLESLVQKINAPLVFADSAGYYHCHEEEI